MGGCSPPPPPPPPPNILDDIAWILANLFGLILLRYLSFSFLPLTSILPSRRRKKSAFGLLCHSLPIFSHHLKRRSAWSMWPTVFRKTRSERKSISRTCENTHFSTKTLMEIKKKKPFLLVDEASDWLQIWTAPSSLNVKGNKAIKKKIVFLANRLVFPNTVTL